MNRAAILIFSCITDIHSAHAPVNDAPQKKIIEGISHTASIFHVQVTVMTLQAHL